MSVTSTVPPKETFRIDMLWNDSRYRSSFLQIIALFGVLVALLYLVSNVQSNLADLGKEFGFSFMSTPASYDINQMPIDYSSRDSHARAAMVGMLNTLLVAVFGCLLATVIGVLAGVGRLSKNWILRNLMGVYVEMVRNIPVLIQILLLSAVISETLPQPRDFRGEDPAASMVFWDSVAATNRGIYVPWPTWLEGSVWVVAALIAGIIGSVIFGRWAQARQQATGEILPVFPIKAGIILILPLIAFFIMGMPIGLDYPALKGFNFKGGMHLRESYVSLTLALAIYTGAFIAENVRAGIQAVSKGQTEAAFALGLQPGRTMSLVILPQALRIIIPPMISQYLNLTKNSSLALLVGYMDATGTLAGITLLQTGREFETLFLLMAFYLAVSLSVSAVMNLYNENSKLVERTSVTGGGFSFLNFFEGMSGPWETLKKGDAIMRRGYGIRGVLNLYVLFYAAVLVMLVMYLFIDRAVVGVYLDVLKSFPDNAAIAAALADGSWTNALPEALPGPVGQSDVQAALEYYLAQAPQVEEALRAVNSKAPEGAVSAEHLAVFVEGLGPKIQSLAPDFYLRPNYFTWPFTMQLITLAMVALAFGALITCIFKNGRFIDMAVLELIMLGVALLAGFPFGQLTGHLGLVEIVLGGVAIRILIIAYTIFGPQPNLTFFNRVRRA